MPNSPRSVQTVVGVVVPEDEGMPPGMDELADRADLRLARTDEQLAAMAGEVEVLCIWDFRASRLGRIWGRAPGLKWVHASSAGVDAIAFPELAGSGIVVTNTRGALDESIAEWVVGVMLMFAKDLRTTLALQEQRRWRHRDSERLAGRRAVVVGAGSIGSVVGARCRAMGMEVDGVASRPRPGNAVFGLVAGPSDLHDVLSRADYVVVCAPLTAATRGMIGADELSVLPAGARLINVGRGPIVDEAALLEALRSGRLAGAALDVFEQEPLPQDHPFWAMDNVVVSPHQAGDFHGWEQAFSDIFVENFRRYRRGEPLLNVVDIARLMPAGERV